MSRCFSGSIKYCKTLPWSYLRLEKSTHCGKIIFQKDAESSVALVLQNSESSWSRWRRLRECVCVCVCLLRRIILWYLIILLLRLLWKSSLYLFSDIPHSDLWRSWLHILANTLWPLSLKKLLGAEIFTICFNFSDSKYYGCLECICFIHTASIHLPSACSMLHTQQSPFISGNC